MAAAQQTSRPTSQQIKEDTPQDALVPFIGFNTGGGLFGDLNVTGDLSAKPRAYGASLLFWGPGVLAGEADFGYSPKFFNGLDAAPLGSTSNLLTATLNFVVGPTFFIGQNMRVRPYGLIGGGLMRSTMSEFGQFLSFKDPRNLGVVDIAGGVYFYPIRRLGVRGDFRYFKGVGANESADGWGAIKGWDYYRISIGAAIAF